MQRDAVYHLTSLVLILIGGLVHLDFRRRESRARGELLHMESTVTKELRRLAIMVSVLAVLLHTLRPQLLAWGEFPLLPPVRWMGAAITSAGIIGVFAAERALLRSSVPMVQPGSSQSPLVVGLLVTTGPYTVIRHPIYMSFALMAGGIALLSASSILAVLGAAITAHLLLVLAPAEEVQLADLYAAEWSAYSNHIPRFLPTFHA